MSMNAFWGEKVLAFVAFSKELVPLKFRNPCLEGQAELRR